MRSLLEEDPTEILGLEEENDPMELIGSEEDEEEEPREFMGLGDDDEEDEELVHAPEWRAADVGGEPALRLPVDDQPLDRAHRQPGQAGDEERGEACEQRRSQRRHDGEHHRALAEPNGYWGQQGL